MVAASCPLTACCFLALRLEAGREIFEKTLDGLPDNAIVTKRVFLIDASSRSLWTKGLVLMFGNPVAG